MSKAHTIKVVNKHTYKPVENEVVYYIGRGSPLGNPFCIAEGTNRDQVCDKYETWFKDKLANNDSSVNGKLDEILSSLKTNDIALMCYCEPKRCHGDTIKQYLESKQKEKTDD